ERPDVAVARGRRPGAPLIPVVEVRQPRPNRRAWSIRVGGVLNLDHRLILSRCEAANEVARRACSADDDRRADTAMRQYAVGAARADEQRVAAAAIGASVAD